MCSLSAKLLIISSITSVFCSLDETDISIYQTLLSAAGYDHQLDVLTSEQFDSVFSTNNVNRTGFLGGREFESACAERNSSVCVKFSSTECHSTPDVFNSLSHDDGTVGRLDIIKNVKQIIHVTRRKECLTPRTGAAHSKPTTAQIWGYSMSFAAGVNLISNVGAFMTPCMSTKFFKRMLMFMVGMAAGTMMSTGLLVLLPETFEFSSIEVLADGYVRKCSGIVAGMYILFLSERILHLTSARRNASRKRKKAELSILPSPDTERGLDEQDGTQNGSLVNTAHGHSHGDRKVKSIAWILLLGDSFHKFIDGLSIGAAFSQQIYTGISVSLAILTEELPHELGDIAILLHSGLPMTRALCYNCIAAIFCFFGVIVGVFLGELPAVSHWIFAIAAGMFIYIALADLFPEMATVMKQEQGENGPFIVFVLHNLGMVIGYILIALVALYSGDIDV